MTVEHEAEQMISLESSTITGVKYENTFTAITDDQPWRPERLTDWPSIKGVMNASRDGDGATSDGALDAVIDAVWDWIDAHPDEAALLYSQLPGATPQVTALRQGFEEQHVQQAFRYFSGSQGERPATVERAVETVLARTLVDLLISVHTMRLAGGPLGREPSRKLRTAVHRLAGRLVSS